MNDVKLSVKLLDEGLEPPSYAHEGDAGLDLRSTVAVTLEAGERAVIPCGIAISIPAGHAGLVVPRSGLAAKHGISVVNAPGLIDSGYRGEIKAVLINTDLEHPYAIQRGDRIAQLVIIETPCVRIKYAETLDDSQRGQGGFGSSGT